MFKLLTEIHQSFFDLSPKEYEQTVQSIGSCKIAADIINQMAVDMGFQSWNRIKVVNLSDPLNIVAMASSQVIGLPTLALMNLPTDLMCVGEHDPKLNDMNFIQKIADFLCEERKIPKIQVGFQHRDILKLYFKTLENPEKAKKALQFIMAHEIAHIKHKHVTTSFFSPVQVLKTGILFSIVSFVLNTVGLGLPTSTSIALSVLTTSLTITMIVYKFLIEKSINQEKEADQSAARLNQGIAEGGIYLFETVRDFQKNIRINSSSNWYERYFYRFIFSPSGHNLLFSFTHPNETARIKALKVELQLKQTLPS